MKNAINADETFLSNIVSDTIVTDTFVSNGSLTTLNIDSFRDNVPDSSNVVGLFSMSAQTTGFGMDQFGKAPIVVNTPAFDAGLNQFKFPFRGWYSIDFLSSLGDGIVALELVRWRIRVANIPTLGRAVTHSFASDGNDRPNLLDQITFFFNCTDPVNDRVELQFARELQPSGNIIPVGLVGVVCHLSRYA